MNVEHTVKVTFFPTTKVSGLDIEAGLFRGSAVLPVLSESSNRKSGRDLLIMNFYYSGLPLRLLP